MTTDPATLRAAAERLLSLALTEWLDVTYLWYGKNTNRQPDSSTTTVNSQAVALAQQLARVCLAVQRRSAAWRSESVRQCCDPVAEHAPDQSPGSLTRTRKPCRAGKLVRRPSASAIVTTPRSSLARSTAAGAGR